MYNLIIDEKGWLLISTYEKGLVHLNPANRSFIQYTKEDGLPSNEGVDIVAGGNGIFWVNTRIGSAKFDTRKGKISAVGLPKIRYNTGIFKASDNQIYVGANVGLLSFYPDQVLGNPCPPQVVISDLLISEANFLGNNRQSDEMVFSHQQNDIAFKYVGLHYSNPENNSYQYKLDPIDDEWIDAGHERMVRFANLSPGKYSFQVKASNSDGVWSSETASVQFTINPAWWRTWWAYIIYLAIAIAFADRFYRFQLSRRLAVAESKKLKELNQVKNSLFTNITHEFRTPLTVIKGMTGAIKTNLEKNQLDDMDTSLEMIDRNSESLLHLVNEMLDLAKIESGNMELQKVQADVIPFIKYVSESFHSLAEENQINLTIYSETDALIMDFDANKLTSVISNLLSNAIKFTPEFGKIIVHIKQLTQKENSYLFLKIQDSGIGIPGEELPNIFNRFYQTDASSIRKAGGTGIGLALTKELVDLMQGTIEVKSILNEGSEFSIHIPVSRKAPVSENIELSKIPQSSDAKRISTKYKQIVETDSELP
ncbi:MAG: ATP-binding protein, partial [Anaerolineales bacterium]